MDINENEEHIEEELEQVLPELEDLPVIESDDTVEADAEEIAEVDTEDPADPDVDGPEEVDVEEPAESDPQVSEFSEVESEIVELEDLPAVDPEDANEEVDESAVESAMEEIISPVVEDSEDDEPVIEVEEPLMVEQEEIVEEKKDISPGYNALAEPVKDDGRAWYVVHCYSGNEDKVRHNIMQRIESMGMDDLIFDVVVPTEDEVNIKNGERQTVEKKVFPGYILVNMTLTEESWYMVRNTPGVTGFVGMGNDPTALQPEEVARILKRMESESPRINVTFRQGERVRIVDGPFEDFYGKVAEIDMNRATVRVMVNFFGRETPVELDFLQVEEA
ncbi:MAG: transcription termination/antitermination protein NusG [Anaerolineales bacterium]|nr:transcription termination/antitermination protein NusG [Anaerolineales bacterium]